MLNDTQPTQEAPTPAPETPPAAPEQQPQQPVKPSVPAATPIKTTQEERMWAAIGYIAFLGVVTLAMMPKSEFCKKHAQQGILLFVFWFIGLIVMAMPIALLSGIGGLILLGITVIAILGIVKSISSYELKLPVLSDLAKMVPAEAIVGSLTGKPTEKGTPAATPTPTEAPKVEEEKAPAPAAAPTEAPKVEEQPPAPAAAPETPTPPPTEEKPQEPQA